MLQVLKISSPQETWSKTGDLLAANIDGEVTSDGARGGSQRIGSTCQQMNDISNPY